MIGKYFLMHRLQKPLLPKELLSISGPFPDGALRRNMFYLVISRHETMTGK